MTMTASAVGGYWVGTAGRVGTRVGYIGWVIPGPSTDALCSGSSAVTAKRAPEALQGAGVGGHSAAGERWAGRVYPHPPGPVGHLRCPPWDIPLDCPPGANTARFHDILLKVSQNGQVSPENVNKASHSPCFQNGLRKSPLEILRFPFWRAFSHKELSGHFGA